MKLKLKVKTTIEGIEMIRPCCDDWEKVLEIKDNDVYIKNTEQVAGHCPCCGEQVNFVEEDVK